MKKNYRVWVNLACLLNLALLSSVHAEDQKEQVSSTSKEESSKKESNDAPASKEKTPQSEEKPEDDSVTEDKEAPETKDENSKAPAEKEPAVIISEIQYTGNKRIDPETIASYLPLKVGDECNSYVINESLKVLNKTGFFEKININLKGKKLIVDVTEYPIIEKISFEGNSKVKTKDLKNAINIKPNEVLSPAKIKEFQNGILESYRSLGKYNASVNPKIIKLGNNRVNLVFEIKEGKSAGIRRIDFVGNKTFSSSELRDVMSSKIKRWFRLFVHDDIYDAERLSHDKTAIEEFYKEHGYADFKILSSVVELSSDKRGFIITITVEEGEVYKVSDVKVKSYISKIKDDELKKDLNVKKGSTYNLQRVNEDIAKMTKKGVGKGFASSKVVPEMQKDEKKRTLAITYNLAEGEKIYISKITIRGNSRTRDHIIRREILLQEGDCLNEALLAMSERNLSNLGFFKKVSVTPVMDSQQPDKCSLQVDVEEKSTGQAMISASYSTATGFGLDLSYGDSNFVGTGKSVSLSIGSSRTKVGQDYVKGADGLPKKKDREAKFEFCNNVSGRVADPHLFGTDMEGSINGFRQVTHPVSDFSMRRYGGGTGVSYSLTDKIQQSWEYTLARRNFHDVYAYTTPIIRYQTMKRNEKDVPIEKMGKSNISSIEHSIGFGHYFHGGKKGYFKTSLNTTFAGLGGDAKHFINDLMGVYVLPIVRKTTIKFAGSVGLVTKVGDHNPLMCDTFSKGLESFRGFDDAGLGPRAVANYKIPGREKLFESKCYVGGKKYWKGTVELKFPLGLPEELQLRGFVFTDFGRVWDAPEKGDKFLKKEADGKTTCEWDQTLVKHEIIDDKYIRASIGFGVSLMTPMGPIIFTYAHPVRKAKHDETQKFLMGFTTAF